MSHNMEIIMKADVTHERRAGRRAFLLECALLAAGTTLLMLVVFAIDGLSPFGGRSLACTDGDIQYLDFFAYLKDVMSGANHATYSFDKVLGGNTFGIFAYYLTSPLNLLVAFFDKADLTTFFDVLVVAKLSCASVAFRVFLRLRYQRSAGSPVLPCLLSLSYALSQYCVAQASNIMWLDGVIMLPLIMLGVHYVIRGEGIAVLSVSVGLSILFNWYAGAINCLFSALWLVAELLLLWAHGERLRGRRPLARAVGTYALAMAVGVLLSGFLLVPALRSMTAGSKAGMEWSLLKSPRLTGNPLRAIRGFALGSISGKGQVALWCGSVALGGCLLSVWDGDERRRLRAARAVLFAAYVLIPLFSWSDAVFSLLKQVSSYWYRYTYGSIAAIVALAAGYLLEDMPGHARRPRLRTALAASATFGGLMICLLPMRVEESAVLSQGGGTAVSTVASVALLITVTPMLAQTAGPAPRRRMLPVLAVVAIGELLCGASLLAGAYSLENVSGHHAYSMGARAQIDALQSRDPSAYRINSTWTRGVGDQQDRHRAGIRAHYNDALAYGYMSIAGYSSCPDDAQLAFLNAMGYRRAARMMCATNDSLVAADSLLGVRYVLARQQPKGLVPEDGIPQNDGVGTYRNPYALPMALTYGPTDVRSDRKANGGNPFLYQDSLWSELLGREANLYRRLEFEQSVTRLGDEYQATYEAAVPSGNWVVYGNIPWRKKYNALLNVNGRYNMAYSCWLSPSVFPIPYDQGDGKRGGNGDELLTSVPYEANWTVTVNGRAVSPRKFGGTLISVPLVEGDNDVVLTYRVPGVMMGALGTLAGASLLVVAVWRDRTRRRRRGSLPHVDDRS